MPSDSAWKPTRRWRRHVYYKVQIHDPVSLVWRDEKPAFDTLEAAKEHISREVPADATSRIMEVDGKQRRPLSGE